MRKTIKLTICLGLLFPAVVLAHPGNTDSVGCHTCRTNCAKWGLSQNEYHCHRSKGVEQPKEPVRSSAAGVTVPAPEYKQPVVKKPAPDQAKEVKEDKATTTTASIRSETKIFQKSFFQSLFELFR